MDSFTLNKIAGAVLGTCLIGMGIGIVADEIYKPEKPKKPGYALPEGKAEEAKGGKEDKGSQLAALLAKADPKKGEADAKVCGGCHNFEEGAGAKVGPDLYGVVDREKGSVKDFDYSPGMKKKGGKWTFEDLDQFITKPSSYVQGTKMGYGGESNAEKRADIIVYLRSLSKKPVELPKVAAGGDKKGGGDKKEAGGDDQLIKLIGSADPKKGESDAQVCSACHNFKKGEGNKVGPDLYGVVDREKGKVEGFEYSPGMKKKGGKWTYADLNEFLTKPSKYVQGTKMGYGGESNEKKRASIIAYLRSNADKPAPLPKGGEAKAGGGDKKGDGKESEGANKESGDKAGGDKKAEGGKDAGGGFVKLVAAADPAKGKSAAQVCSACHSLEKGGGTLVGPHLWGVVDRDKGSVADFSYSPGMKKKGGKWTYDDLNKFLTKPSAYVQGTKMGYQGESNEKKRAEIVAFLRTLADSPAPLPGADGGDKKADAKPTDKKAEAKPEDKKAEAKPEDKKAEAKPEDKKPEAKPEDKKAEAKPEEKKPEAKPEDKKAEDKPAPEKKSEAKPEAAPAGKTDGPEPYKAEAPEAPAEAPAPASTTLGDKTAGESDTKAGTGDKAAESTTEQGGGPEPYKAEAPEAPAEAPAPASTTLGDKAAGEPDTKAGTGDKADESTTEQGGGPEPFKAPAPEEAK